MSASRQNMAAAVNLIGSAVADPTREFAFSDEDFKTLSRLAYEHAGIVLAESKRNLIYGRLSRRLRALGITTFRDYRAEARPSVKEFYRLNHMHQTLDFVKSKHREFLPLDWKQRLTREVEGLAPHPRRAAGFSHRRPSWLDCCDVATRFGNRLGRPRTRKTRIGNSSKKKLNGQ